MILLHKLNGAEFVLNCDHIETIDITPDSVITLMNEKKYVVKESHDEILEKAIEYQQKKFCKFQER